MNSENIELTEIESAVKQVVDMFGAEIINEKKRFCSALKDFAPKLSAENKVFFVALGENIGEIYLRENEAVLTGKKSASEVMERVSDIIGEYLNRSKSEMVARSLAVALGWDIGVSAANDTDRIKNITGGTLVEELVRQFDNGNKDAGFNLGECFYYGRSGVKQDFAKAVEWYTKASKKGDCNSQKKLAECYRTGKGVERDFAKAVYWYEQAAEQGDHDSRRALMICCKTGGPNLASDNKMAQKIAERYCMDSAEGDEVVELIRGAESGSAGMQYSLGNAYFDGKDIPSDREKAVYWYERAAEQNYCPAMFNLAYCYSTGTGTDRDTARAAEIYEKAAKLGDLDSMNNLAALYFRGDGVEKDLRMAAVLWEKAAEGGLARAQYNFAECKFNGWGCMRNMTHAAAWYKKAADRSDPDAQYSLGWCYLNGTGVAKDMNKAKMMFELASQKMNAAAQTALGYCHMNGLGTEKNYARAAECFSKAAQQGDKDAAKMYVLCYKNGGYFLLRNEEKAQKIAAAYNINYYDI